MAMTKYSFRDSKLTFTSVKQEIYSVFKPYNITFILALGCFLHYKAHHIQYLGIWVLKAGLHMQLCGAVQTIKRSAVQKKVIC